MSIVLCLAWLWARSMPMMDLNLLRKTGKGGEMERGNESNPFFPPYEIVESLSFSMRLSSFYRYYCSNVLSLRDYIVLHLMLLYPAISCLALPFFSPFSILTCVLDSMPSRISVPARLALQDPFFFSPAFPQSAPTRKFEKLGISKTRKLGSSKIQRLESLK